MTTPYKSTVSVLYGIHIRDPLVSLLQIHPGSVLSFIRNPGMAPLTGRNLELEMCGVMVCLNWT